MYIYTYTHDNYKRMVLTSTCCDCRRCLFRLSYTMNCTAGFMTNTRDGTVPLHRPRTPSCLPILRNASDTKKR